MTDLIKDVKNEVADVKADAASTDKKVDAVVASAQADVAKSEGFVKTHKVVSAVIGAVLLALIAYFVL